MGRPSSGFIHAHVFGLVRFLWFFSYILYMFLVKAFSSWVAIFHLRPPMGFLFHSLNDMRWFAPLMSALLWGPRDFSITFSHVDMPPNAWSRHRGNSMDVTGILFNNMRSPPRKSKWHSWAWSYTVTPSIDQTLHQPISCYWTWPRYQNRPFNWIREVFMEHLWRIWRSDREHFPVSSGVSICSDVEPVFPEFVMFPVFMPPAWRVRRGYLVIGSSVCPSVRLYVCP